MSATDAGADGAAPHWLSERFTGRSGIALCIRPLGAADAASERRFIEGLSAQSLYQRLLGVVTAASDEQLERLVRPDWPHGLALAVFRCAAPGERGAGTDAGVGTDAPDEILGVARFAASGQPQEAEFGIVIADAWQGQGLGHALFERLVRAARAAGYRELVGTTFADNRDMVALARAHGFQVTHEEGERGQRRLTLPLQGGPERAPASGA